MEYEYNRKDIEWLDVIMAAKHGNLRYYLPWMAYNFPKLSLILIASAGVALPKIVANEIRKH